MHAADLTIPQPAQPVRTTRIAAIAVTVTAVLLVVAGTAALAANTFRDGNGYFNTPTKTFTSSGYAIAMKSVDISYAPQWALNAGLDSVRVKAHSDRPLFIGIARAADVDRYLRGTEHDDVSHLNYQPFEVDYDHTNGTAAPVAACGSRSGSSRPAAAEASRSPGSLGPATGAQSS